MLKILLRTVLTTVMFATVNSIYSQTKWHQEPLRTPLLEKAEFKIIEYKSIDYTAIGYVYKDRFLDGQNVTFLSKQTQDTIVSGRYHVFENRAYIDGLWKRNTENGITRAYGLFQVKNAENGIAFTIRSKEAKPLQINTKDIFLYQGFHNKYPATITKQDYSAYVLTVTYPDSSDKIFLQKVQMKVDEKLIGKYGFYAISDFVLYTTDVTRHFNEGTVFTGRVENFQVENNNIESEIREGKFTHTQGDNDEEELIKLPDGNFKYRVMYSDRKWDNIMAQMEIVVRKSVIEKYGYWATGKYIQNTLDDVICTYKNGDIYIGKKETQRDSINEANIITTSKLTEGKLRYATGEEFEGNLNGEWFCGVPISGTMEFTDGSIEKGNWLERYYIQSPQEIEEIESAKTPTEKKIMAEKIYQKNQNQYQQYIYEAETALDSDDFESAETAYSNALKLNPQNGEYIKSKIVKVEKWKSEEKKRLPHITKQKSFEYKQVDFNEEYTSTNNEAKASHIFNQANKWSKDFMSVDNFGFKLWQGKLVSINTSKGAKTTTVVIESRIIIYHALIPYGNEVYNQLMELNEGDKILFSGQFKIKDGILEERSFTESGRMHNPEFYISLTLIEKKN